ncbi:MAG TPA: anhydro-N-acetylmuramic acid kinase, partial [Beijerinckiaceae bacterium]
LPVVWDMRAADVAAGGQGAPLAPAWHRALALAGGLDLPIAALNLGGVGNVTFVPAAGDPVAFDTGPGNALLDDLMLARTGRAMDRDGACAAAGRVDAAALAALTAHPYFDAPPPKSLDRNAFSIRPVEGLSTEDAAATLAAFTVATVMRGLAHLPATPRLLVVCGGGARNGHLMRLLAEAAPCPVAAAGAVGWDGDALEAQAFAYLGARARRGLPLTWPTTTGVGAPTPGGVVTLPRTGP